MEEKRENGSVFENRDNADTGAEKNLNLGLDSATFDNETNVQKEQSTIMYTVERNANTYVPEEQINYYTRAEVPIREKKQNKALEICTLIFGIISLCGCCYGLFGLVGLVLGIIALATGKKSGLSIAGLVLSVLGIGTAVAWIAFNFSSAGQQWRDVFWKNFQDGFEKGYNSTYNGGEINTEDEKADELGADVNSSEDSSLTSQVISKVTIDGKEITIPCKFSEVKNEFDFSKDNENDLNKELDIYDSRMIYLASDGNKTGVNLLVENKDTAIADINEAYVIGVNMDNYGDASIDTKFFKDITLGMKQEELERVLSDISYGKDQDENYDYYVIKSGEYDEFDLTVTVKDGQVLGVSVVYYGTCE